MSMQSKALNPDEYIRQIPVDKLETFSLIRNTVLENLPEGFVEEMSYGMIGYVVPFSIYPNGYHCDRKLPLPLMHLAAQKNFIALYHLGLYTDPGLLRWFTEEYPKYSKLKLDMGKGCVRFKNQSQIPFVLIGELIKRIEVDDWIKLYEAAYIKK